MEKIRAISIAIGCIMASHLEANEKQEVIEVLRNSQENSFDQRLGTWITEWKNQVGKQIECQNKEADHDICPNCDEQLYFCDCACQMAEKILELQFGYDDFLDED